MIVDGTGTVYNAKVDHPGLLVENRSRSSLPFKSISASVLLISGYYLYSNQVEAEANYKVSLPPSPFVNSSPSAIISELNDTRNRVAVEAKSTEDLALALFVYKLCSLPWLVDVAPQMISIAETFHLQAPLYWLIKQTFFRHFCGGETPEECISSMDKLAKSGINCILDLSVEADLHVDKEDKQITKSKYHRDDQQADITLKMIKTCITTAAGGVKPNSMAAIKVTAFSPPRLLLRLNHSLALLNQSFLEHQENGQINADGIRNIIHSVLSPSQSEEQQKKRDEIIEYLEHKQRTLDIIEFRTLFNFQGPTRDIWWSTDKEDTTEAILNNEDLEAYDRMINRLEQICTLAYNLNVSIMVDAEQSYFQEAIDHVAINLQRKFNHRTDDMPKYPTVYNTYQMYTKAAQGKMEIDAEVAKRENFTFAAKLVRGAYMVSERKRAQQLDYPSPIHETLEDTNQSFDGGVKFLLSKIGEHQEMAGEPLDGSSSPIVFMVASHNRESVVLTIEEMERYNISPNSDIVHFGQLYGMQDQLSYVLGRHGYSIYKYLPYGMINEVIPYLLRRAQENSAVLGGVANERLLLWNEFKSRISGKTPVPAEVPITDTTITSV
ncbi:FAD-linked oxidoreductase-like protein [Pilobolus umbonatus]|nr:FAD-linked oxidoreductase-like protein [Pilobolus umbonatus]